MADGLKLIPLSEVGLMTGEEVAALKGCDPTTVRRWARRGEIPVVQVGTGRSAKYLYRRTDAEKFVPNTVGAPQGNTNAAKKRPARKRRGE